ncbi:hypothetical protein F2Q68_00040139 [Brassica cretica]|uniref:Uncharacterized protein n=1 Tax=Brassica cretica TaxID=69181 RepID=A0A8S9MKG5_BRACR|nr:hypothetical protein F2Q68_00040139 [Brassica cretica]
MRVAPWVNALLICPWFPRGRVFPLKYVEARSLGNIEKHVALASFRSISGRWSSSVPDAWAGFLSWNNSNGTTPTELDEYSKIDASGLSTDLDAVEEGFQVGTWNLQGPSVLGSQLCEL